VNKLLLRVERFRIGQAPPRFQAQSLPRPARWIHSAPRIGYDAGDSRRMAMAKGQVRKNKEARKPKKEKPKTIAANPSTKGGPRGLESLENLK
jgi:hypothetical protein